MKPRKQKYGHCTYFVKLDVFLKGDVTSEWVGEHFGEVVRAAAVLKSVEGLSCVVQLSQQMANHW